MVGRTIDREIERDLHSAVSDLLFEPGKIFKSPESRLDRLVSAPFAADGVRHAGFAGFGGNGIVAALPVAKANGMDRRKIDHVEPHRPGVVDARQAVSKSRASIAVTFRGTGKKFIPRGGPRLFAIDHHARRGPILRGAGAVGIARHQNFKLSRMRDLIDLGRLTGAERIG
jgi:hypothetical protein